jgi:hypothetical protein
MEMTVADALKRLRDTHGNDAPSYPRFWRSIVDGRVPAVRRAQRWAIQEQDFGRVETVFRLPVTPAGTSPAA